MIYHLDDNQREQLLNQTEHGMGYQLAVDRACVFLNAEIAIDLVDCEVTISRGDVERLTDLLLEGADYQAKLEDLGDYGNRGLEVAAHGSYPSQTVQGEKFWRYSAFRNDRRIQPDGSVLPGTYATTETTRGLCPPALGPSDATLCRTTSRRALPP